MIENCSLVVVNLDSCCKQASIVLNFPVLGLPKERVMDQRIKVPKRTHEFRSSKEMGDKTSSVGRLAQHSLYPSHSRCHDYNHNHPRLAPGSALVAPSPEQRLTNESGGCAYDSR